jgi:hypothetical protein
MGGGSFSSDDFRDHATTRNYASKSVEEVINTTKVINAASLATQRTIRARQRSSSLEM